MTKKGLILIVLSISFSSAGLLYFQYVWVKNIYTKTKNEYISQINIALDDFVSYLEKDEIVQIIINQKYKVEIDSQKLFIDLDLIAQDFNLIKNTTKSPDSILLIDKRLKNLTTTKPFYVLELFSQLTQKRINISERVDSNKIDKILRFILLKHHIEEKFEYVVRTNNKIYIKTKNYNLAAADIVFKRQLYPNDIYLKEKLYLEIYFEYKKLILYKKMPKIIWATLFFVILTILIFFVTIWALIKQKKLYDLRTEFVNNLTHEIKTPISTISLATQMLNEQVKEKNFLDILNIISEESKKLYYQVEKILQLAMLEKGKLSFKYEVYSANNLIENILNTFIFKLSSVNGSLNINLKATNDEIYIDKVHFINIINNILDNALKYSIEKVEIDVETFNENDYFVIKISDKGIGIPKDKIKYIFEPFYRISNSDTYNIKGFGLGLSYVKKIMNEFKGKIKVISDIGAGTTFFLYFNTIKNK